MPKRSVALIGPGRGPAVHLYGVAAQLKVTGLHPEESALAIQVLGGADDVATPLMQDGLHDLVECQQVYILYEGKNRSFVACVEH